MGSGSAGWYFKKCIIRFSQKRLRELSRRSRQGGCIYTGPGDFSSEMSSQFQSGKRPLALHDQLVISNHFPDQAVKNSSSSNLRCRASAALLTPSKDRTPEECAKKAEIAPTHESGKETVTSVYPFPFANHVLSCFRRPKALSVGDSELERHRRSYQPTIAPEPKKGILKPGISIVHESDVPIVYKIQTDCGSESGVQAAKESEPRGSRPSQTHADKDNTSTSSAAQQNMSNRYALISIEPRIGSDYDLGRSSGLIKVPPSRGTSRWCPPRGTTQSPPTPTPQGLAQTCSFCRFAHNLGKPPRLLTAERLRLATNFFCNENFLDNGESEFVYKGCLEGHPVAIKTIRHQDSLDKFSAEIAILTHVQHPNVVSLVGYCLEDKDRALVYNYACNRSLHWHLCSMSNGTKFMAWKVRKKLAINLARGLQRIHSEYRGGGVIHGDIRSRNIFLNHDMVPMIGGFGQSRWQECVLNPLTNRSRKLNPGYVAPEYMEGGQISEKVDVYAFGIVLLELITGRRAVDRSLPEEQRVLVNWARPWLESPIDYDTLKREILDTQLMGEGQECTEGEMMCTIHAARLCLRKDPLMRPRMIQVLDILSSSDHDDCQDCSSPSLMISSAIVTRNDRTNATTNRNSQSAALATLRATDPTEMRSLGSRHSNNFEDLELFRSAPSTPNLNELMKRDRDFAASCTVNSHRSLRSSNAGSRTGSGKVTQLFYQPLHYLTNSSCNKPRQRVSFKKGTTPRRLSYFDLLAS